MSDGVMSDGAHKRERPDFTEARCDRCGESFMPPDPSDLLHFQRRDGQLCGGEGVAFRKYVIRKSNRD